MSEAGAPGRFLLFAYTRHNESGGMGDYCGSFDTLDDLSDYVLRDEQKWMRDREDAWAETFDLRRGLVCHLKFGTKGGGFPWEELPIVIMDEWRDPR